ncbi:MAG TPA: sialidase family protein [Blastocatellia bacterium]|nr:sialidase family protein [Blastocatellia bacterium]
MNRKAAFVVFFAILLALAAGGLAPRPVSAQFPQFFGSTRFPAIQVDGSDRLYMAMSVATAPASEHRPHSQIFFTQSRDGGASWDNLPQTRNLTNSPGEAFGPSLVVSKEGPLRVYIAYHDNSTGTYEAYFLRTKKKTKFRQPQNLTPGGGAGFSPRLGLATNGQVNFVYGDTTDNVQRVRFMRSTDEGATFSDPVTISGDSTTASEPEIAMTPGDAINVVWEARVGDAGVILFARSTDGGATFSAPTQVSRGDGSATEAALATDETGRLSVVWAQTVGSEKHVFYSHSSDDGQTFSEPQQLTSARGTSVSKPLAVAFHNVVYVAYQDEAPRRMQVFLMKSEDSGASFADPVQVSNANNNCGRAHSAAMVVDSTGALHIVWIDASHVQGCADEGLLFYSRSRDGRRFSAEQLILAGI